jgi:ZIP family zinc transporter
MVLNIAIVSVMLFVFAALTVASTFGGGTFALHQSKRMHLVLGFTAGVVLGVVAFDLLPEVFAKSGDVTIAGVPAAMLMLIAGFMVLHVVEQALALHHGHEGSYGEHRHPDVGLISATGLAVHSAMDGLALGLAAQAGGGTLAVVAVAVIAHDFSDGINTIGIMKAHGNTSRRARVMLIVDSLAPLIGAASTLLFTIPSRVLGLYLGFFAGFLLYIATSDILPEAHSRNPSRATFAFTFLGLGFTWVVVSALSHL